MQRKTLDLVESAINKGITYAEYRNLVSELLLEKQSTGPEQTDDLLDYSTLNNQRMKRLDKTIKISEDYQKQIKVVDRPLTFLVITEGWCGDASQSLPVINKIAELNSNFQLKIILRDDNPELMDAFLTNGGRSIPKVIIYNRESKSIVADWGPRPKPATKLVEDYKERHGALDGTIKEKLQIWYNKDKGKAVIEDLLDLL